MKQKLQSQKKIKKKEEEEKKLAEKGKLKTEEGKEQNTNRKEGKKWADSLKHKLQTRNEKRRRRSGL